jgi:predicted dehydrogenase/threonine dehydrogenase-like Zn-dependent dehydrogenase
MKQISQNYKTGRIELKNVHSPTIKPGGILVKTEFSLISAGTEGMKVREGKMNLAQKAIARPDQVKKVIQTIKQQGLISTFRKVMNKLDSLTPLGYSSSGIVTAIGSGCEEFTIGQRVACAGAGYANHSEINFIPKNLAVSIPEEVSTADAAYATVGAIAMQGYRQSDMQLGEFACVIGLGLLGQLLVQILRSAGITVVGVDLNESRCDLAVKSGVLAAYKPDDSMLRPTIDRFTSGHGVDVVFITAGGDSNDATELAVTLLRDRGRVVDIGKTKLDLDWKSYYEKEIDVKFSRSYGPGRYDPTYEEKGIDYPIGYVRWTEKRNMQSFLQLLAEKKIDLSFITESIVDFANAEAAYQQLATGTLKGVGVLFRYSGEIKTNPKKLNRLQPKNNFDKVRFGVIGAGNYASSMLLPLFALNKSSQLVEVATATSLSAENAKSKFNFISTSNNYHETIASTDIDAILIATRHKSHASITAEALRAGKAVFVEKPLSIDIDGLELVREAVNTTGNDRLHVGFNRRFSQSIQLVKSEFDNTTSPIFMMYRVHAGKMDSTSWYNDPDEGSRFIGEAGHFIDTMGFLCQSRPISVIGSRQHPNNPTMDDLENIITTIRYENGSVGTLIYLTQGDTSVPKEFLEVFGAGKTVMMDNFEKVRVFSDSRMHVHKLSSIDKGQKGQVDAFVKSIESGLPMPISIDELIDVTLVTIAAQTSAIENRIVQIDEYWVN